MVFQHDFCASDGVGFAGQQTGGVVVGFLFLDRAVEDVVVTVGTLVGAEGHFLRWERPA